MLLPLAGGPVDPVDVIGSAERNPPAGRPWVLVCMVASIDGAMSVDGRTGQLGGQPDKQIFSAVRSVADAILVAAGTVRAEGYGPPTTPAELTAGRAARGQHPHPYLAIVSGSLDLDTRAALFADPHSDARPVVFTVAQADTERRGAIGAVADVIEAVTAQVDLEVALRELGRRGASLVVSEGGPSLIGQLASADLIDELLLTVAPVVVSGESARIAHGHTANLRDFTLANVFESDHVLALRYLRSR